MAKACKPNSIYFLYKKSRTLFVLFPDIPNIFMTHQCQSFNTAKKTSNYFNKHIFKSTET